jgi:hypothetical protein
MTEPTAEQPQVTATVSPAPPPRSRWGAIPHHLGRARTSTVVLSLLFLGIGTLWLNIRPDPVVPASGGAAVVEQPATTPPAEPTTPAPTTETTPPTSEATPTPTPTPTTEAPTPTSTTSDSTTPEETTTDVPTPTTEVPTPLPGTPTSPAG